MVSSIKPTTEYVKILVEYLGTRKNTKRAFKLFFSVAISYAIFEYRYIWIPRLHSISSKRTVHFSVYLQLCPEFCLRSASHSFSIWALCTVSLTQEYYFSAYARLFFFERRARGRKTHFFSQESGEMSAFWSAERGGTFERSWRHDLCAIFDLNRARKIT